jgi:CcmD family protein
MAALATAFSCVWIVLALYVGWMGRHQHRLSSRLREMETLMGEACDKQPPARKAA